MQRKLGWAAAITVLAIGTAALPIALGGSDQPPPPPMGIILGGQLRDDAVNGDQPSPLQLPAPSIPAPDSFILAEPPRQGEDVTGTRNKQQVDDAAPSKVLGNVDRTDLNYLGYDEDDPDDEAHETHEGEGEGCTSGTSAPEWPEDMELTEIPRPEAIRRPPAGPGALHDELCEESIKDEI